MPKKLKTEVKTEPAIKAPEPVIQAPEPVKKVRKPRVKKVVEKSKSKSVEKSKGKSKSPNSPVAGDGPKGKKEKAKKAPSKFAIFMKINYEKVKHLPNKERLGELAKMYKQSNSQ